MNKLFFAVCQFVMKNITRLVMKNNFILSNIHSYKKLHDASVYIAKLSRSILVNFIAIFLPGLAIRIDTRASNVDFAMYIAKLKRDVLCSRFAAIISIGLILFFACDNFGKGVGLFNICPSFCSGIFNSKTSEPYVARINIDGIITQGTYGSEVFSEKMINKIIDDKNIKAVLVRINSPGGSVAASDILYRALSRLSKAKNTVAVVRGVAASGGYLAALGCRKIAALETSIVGSIGVIMKNYNITNIAKKLGIEEEVYRSSKFKASPNALHANDSDVKREVMHGVNEMYNWFTYIVKESRHLNNEEIKIVANGKVFFGREALKYKLIDLIGDYDDVVKKMKDDGEIPQDINIVDVNMVQFQSRQNLFFQALYNIVSNMRKSFVEFVMNDDLHIPLMK